MKLITLQTILISEKKLTILFVMYVFVVTEVMNVKNSNMYRTLSFKFSLNAHYLFIKLTLFSKKNPRSFPCLFLVRSVIFCET